MFDHEFNPIDPNEIVLKRFEKIRKEMEELKEEILKHEARNKNSVTLEQIEQVVVKAFEPLKETIREAFDNIKKRVKEYIRDSADSSKKSGGVSITESRNNLANSKGKYMGDSTNIQSSNSDRSSVKESTINLRNSNDAVNDTYQRNENNEPVAAVTNISEAAAAPEKSTKLVKKFNPLFQWPKTVNTFQMWALWHLKLDGIGIRFKNIKARDLSSPTQKTYLRHVKMVMTFYDLVAKGEAYECGRHDLAPPYSNSKDIMAAYELIKDVLIITSPKMERKKRPHELKWSTAYRYWSSIGISLRNKLRAEALDKIKNNPISS